MRRYGNTCARTLVAAGLARCARVKLSPDRTRNEEIQDRQNAFVWSNKHIFRPHQHFTRDPCSWSRLLEETVKKRQRPSIVERLRVLEQRELEARQSSDATSCDQRAGDKSRERENAERYQVGYDAKSCGEMEEYVANGDYFYTTPIEEELTGQSLQELLDELQNLYVLLFSPRYECTPLATRERLQNAYSETLRCVFDRVRVAVVGETISFDALLFSWCLLLREVTVLLESLAEEQSEECLVGVLDTVRGALGVVVRELNQRVHFWEDCKSLSLEGWIEALAIATHPLTQVGQNDCFGVTKSLQLPPAHECKFGVSEVDRLSSITIQAVMARMIKSNETDTETEVLDPYHLYLLLQCIKRLKGTGVHGDPHESHIRQAALLTRSVTKGIFSALESTVAPPARYALGHALFGKELQRYNGTDKTSCDNVKPRAIQLDMCAPPCGVKEPPTAADDAVLLTRSCTLLVELSAFAQPQTQLEVMKAVDTILKTLSYMPNYDLDASDTLALSCVVVKELTRVGATAILERQLRLLLLLSRARMSACTDHNALGNLLSCMCDLTPPQSAQGDVLLEWKRLRGVVMHHLLQCLRAEEVHMFYTTALRASKTWVEHLAFGCYSGSIPLSLWLEACRMHLSSGGEVTVSCARALVALRGRCRDGCRTHNGATSPRYRDFFSAGPLDFLSTKILARLLQIASNQRCSAEELISSPVAWDLVAGEVQGTLEVDEATMQVLTAAQRCVAERCAFHHLVTSYA